MCGITGSLWTNEAQSISREQLGKMTASLCIEPDDCSTLVLIHRLFPSPRLPLALKLSIIDRQVTNLLQTKTSRSGLFSMGKSTITGAQG